MLIATPFIALFLCLLGFSPEIGSWLHGSLVAQATGWSLGATTVGVIGFLLVLFYTADLFVGTVFWYFFNDVGMGYSGHGEEAGGFQTCPATRSMFSPMMWRIASSECPRCTRPTVIRGQLVEVML